MKRSKKFFKEHENDVEIKCTKIKYDPEYAVRGLKKSVTLYCDPDLLECAVQNDAIDGDPALDMDELKEYVQDELEVKTSCPVIDFEMH